jgi:hypothetical protein
MAAVASSCSSGSSGSNSQSATGDPGALVKVDFASTVGVLLDEVPSSMRQRVANALIAKPSSFWVERARNQIKLTTYRLVFRNFFYGWGSKGQLPFPPPEVQQVSLVGTPRRAAVGGHDYVLVDYTMASVLVTTEASPKAAEAKLANVGGKWAEPFTLPIDPELVFQRTRFACMDEEDFPPNSVDSEEVDSFYDQDCDVENSLSSVGQCHLTELPATSCRAALDAKIGKVDTNANFERIAWNQATANQYRVGTITNPTGPDLQLIEEEFHEHRVVYRYIPTTSCTLVEQCVGGSGWRRLLQFSTSDKNVGASTLDIGAVDYYLSGQKGFLSDYGLFEFSACHQHYHFTHYGDFHYGPEIERKNGFCLQSTSRPLNHEQGPLTHPYGGCDFQGVQASWADQYKAGLECQWVDVTTIDTRNRTATYPLSFNSNPDGLLCEGTLVKDSHGDLIFDPTQFTTSSGATVYAPRCNQFPGYAANNGHSYDVTLPMDGESYVTQACTRGQVGPLRNCGLVKDGNFSCTPGQATTLRCTIQANATPQVARVCEYSFALGVGTACTYQDSLNTSIVESATGFDVSFTCPAARDANEPGGRVTLYTGAVFTDDASSKVTCTAL